MVAMNYAVFSRPKHKGGVSGDAYTVQKGEDFYLFALVDGLGSGEAAAKASHAAVACIQEYYALGLIDLLRRCHQALRSTRGAVLGLLRVAPAVGEVRYVGVGNIGFYALSRERFQPISYNGIVGYRLPRVHEFVGLYTPGDMFVMYSDGIDGRFHGDSSVFNQGSDLKQMADSLARRYGKDDDDVSVLVVR
jgi:negative regulator of sigma-B (phosphoserine phosphatase)